MRAKLGINTRHKNLVHLLGFCLEGSEKILVYEYKSNGSLADILFNSETRPSWEQRMRLALDISMGILYLHEECETCIIHCNIKPHNVLVDDLWTAKISDFGLAKFLVPNQVGNQLQLKKREYLAPELQNSALVDVYSYGVKLLEIICCRSNMDINVSTEDEIFLPTWDGVKTMLRVKTCSVFSHFTTRNQAFSGTKIRYKRSECRS
ncbi:G-type lectin S-receptor-like serine/threonine-protein kinase LECRK2 [Nicotiana tomentosiformis]|uniref:G-type lectin S-receptor-like serine/threonine-protein kinase LECRK2 n=1 Tax=Nicotiana tomentosiformis TaxID=4098 RepID=UPI00388C8B4E